LSDNQEDKLPTLLDYWTKLKEDEIIKNPDKKYDGYCIWCNKFDSDFIYYEIATLSSESNDEKKSTESNLTFGYRNKFKLGHNYKCV